MGGADKRTRWRTPTLGRHSCGLWQVSIWAGGGGGGGGLTLCRYTAEDGRGNTRR